MLPVMVHGAITPAPEVSIATGASLAGKANFVFARREMSRTDECVETMRANVSSEELIFQEPPFVLPWTGYDQVLFHKLLIKKLSAGLLGFEKRQFAELQRKRERTQEPLSTEAIEARERLDNKIEEVLALLGGWIEPIETDATPDHSRTAAPKN